MRFIPLAVLFFSLASYTMATADLYNSESLIIDLNISSTMEVVEESQDAMLKDLTVNLSFFPREWDTQRVVSMTTSPKAEVIADTILFQWGENAPKMPSFLVASRVKTLYKPAQISGKVKFPISDLPEELKKYTLPSETIDSDNEEIVRLASRLAEGEDDEFVVVYKMAEWTRDNVEYDLSTLTADVTQKSSWVLRNRKGVCDEITNLFIALVRSMGIPAKFVSGISYTESELFPFNWGPHGWAEVYFPEYGWVPFDVTFGELGYINPTHIKLKEAVDSQKPATQYYWRGIQTNIKVNPLVFDAGVIMKGKELGSSIKMEVKPLKQEIGFGSYDLIEVEVQNLQDFYIAREIFISSSKELHFFESDRRKDVLLRPREKKSVYFVVNVPEDLNPNYVYEIPIAAKTPDNYTAKSSISVSERNLLYGEDFVKKMLEQRQESEEKTYSREVSMACAADGRIYCTIKNSGNIILTDLSVCLESNCKKMDLGISQEKTAEFPIDEKKPGRYERIVIAKSKDVSVSATAAFSILDEPEAEIAGIEYPKYAKIEEDFPISFILKKASFSEPKNATITISNGIFRRSWSVSSLEKDEQFSLVFSGRNLRTGKNTFELEADYHDDNGKSFESRETFIVENTTPFFSKENLQHMMFDTPLGAGVGVGVISILAFLLIVFAVFRGRKK